MKKWIFGVLTVALALSMVFTMVSCDNGTSSSSTDQVTVTYNANGWTGGGVPSSGGKVNVGSTINLPNLTTSATQTFGGWSLTGSGNGVGGTPITSHVTVKGEDPTFYVLWTAVGGGNFTVTFEVNGGSAVAAQTVANGGKVNQPSTPTKAGNTFDGWYKESAFSTLWNFATDLVSSNITLHAKWTAVPAGDIVITFDADGGSLLGAGSVAIGSGDSLGAKFPANPSKAGFAFQGWFLADGTTEVSSTSTFSADTTIKARWEVTQAYTVTFDSNGGSAVAAQDINSGDKVIKPSDPTKAGNTFDGWYKEATLTTLWNFDTDTVTSAITLYAKWTAVAGATFTVTFDSNGGSAVAAQDIASGGTVSQPADPTKAGNTFGGWYKEVALTTLWNFTTDTVSSDITLYAKWTATGPIIDPSTFVEKLALENGSFAIYEFNLPDGVTFGDFVGLSVDYKLVNPANADGSHNDPDQAEPDDNGNYTQIPNSADARQIRTVRLMGNYVKEGPEEYTDFTIEDPAAYVAKYDDKNGQYIAETVKSWAWDYNGLGDFTAKQGDQGNWFTVEYSLDGGASKTNNHWPEATDTGPFYFGIGISGVERGYIVQLVKNIKLIATPDSGVEDVYSVGSGFDKPAFCGYIPTTKTYSWRGGENDPAPIVVKFDLNFTGAGSGPNGLYTFPNTAVTLPDPVRIGYTFDKWYTDTEGTTVAPATYTKDTTLYAQWTEGGGGVPTPVVDHPYPEATGDTEFELGATNMDWGKKQKGWDNGGFATTEEKDEAKAALLWAKYLVFEVADSLGNEARIVWQGNAASGQQEFYFIQGGTAKDGVVIEEDDGVYTVTIELSKTLKDYYTSYINNGNYVNLLFYLFDCGEDGADVVLSNAKLIVPVEDEWPESLD